MSTRFHRLEEALQHLADPASKDPEAALESIERLADGELTPALAERLVDSLCAGFPRLGRRGAARALKVLASCGTPSALRALNELLASPEGAQVDLSYVFVDLVYEPERAAALFPELLRAMWNTRELTGAIELILRCADAELLEPGEHPEFERRALDRVQEILDRRRLDLDRHAPGFDHLVDYETWEAIPGELLGVFDELEHWLDLLRFFEGTRAEALLRRSLGLASRTLRAWAVGSLLAREAEVEPSLVEDLAAHRGSRGILFIVLRDLGLADAMPARWRTLDALAEAAMVHYLQHPQEWGAAPEDLELLSKREAEDEHGRSGALCFFRFRHTAWGEGWSYGAAGLFVGPDPGLWHPTQTRMLLAESEPPALSELEALAIDERGRLRG
ncbi:MAG: hypothetical protein JNM84_11675 [Planctomycetes bacterium]|nr:hypothetical protein [Planctomycetota bacterium]